jgi:hypothetical protein
MSEIDVERLARALHGSYERDPSVVRIDWTDLSAADQRMWINHARAIAALYAHLSEAESASEMPDAMSAEPAKDPE